MTKRGEKKHVKPHHQSIKETVMISSNTYLSTTDHGKLSFDVNAFDEDYCDPFAWDVKRPSASLNILPHNKGLLDRKIQQLKIMIERSFDYNICTRVGCIRLLL